MSSKLDATVKTVIRWVFGVLFLQLALGGFFTFFPAGIGFLVAGFILIPPLNRWVESKIVKQPLASWQKYLAVFGGGAYSIIIMIMFVEPDKEASTASQSTTPKDSTVVNIDTIAAPDAVEIEKPAPKPEAPAPAEPVYSAPAPTPAASQQRQSSEGRTYFTGRRGGCYYINSNGNKVYVDHSYCQ